MEDMVKKAEEFATKAHEGQFDKAGLPYITHPKAVAAMLDDEKAKVVALLHDTVEDTETKIEDIRREFGDEIAAVVDLLTHKDGADYFDYVLGTKTNELARKVKMADLTHNMDLSRIKEPTKKDYKRIERYKKAYELLKKTEEN